jgi:hypothetical protein
MTKKEFAVKCGIKTNRLAIYIKRFKVEVNKDGSIDDSNPINVLFMEKCLSRHSKAHNIESNAHGTPIESEITPPAPLKAPSKKVENEAFSRQNTKLVEIQEKKGGLDIEGKTNSIELQRIEIRKKRGELVPTESVKNLIIQHSESMKTSYSEASDNLIVIISHKKQLSSDEISDLRKQFTKIVNNAIDNAITFTMTGLRNVVNDFSQKRGVGQHG